MLDLKLITRFVFCIFTSVLIRGLPLFSLASWEGVPFPCYFFFFLLKSGISQSKKFFYSLLLCKCPHYPNEHTCVTIYICHKPSKYDMLGTVQEIRMNSEETFSYGLIYINKPVKNYIYQLCVDTGCRLEDLLGVVNDRDR